MALQLCVFILAFSLCRGSITNEPPDMEACVGEDVNIPWTYDDNAASVVWYKGSTEIMTYFGSGDPVAENSYAVVNHGNGNITLSSVPITYTGAYRIVITAASALEDEVEVTVCNVSAGLTSSKSGQTITCEASDLGTPAAVLRIWIDGTEQPSSSANVTDSNEVSCCLSGCAVKCMNGGSSSDSNSCLEVQVSDGTCPCVCSIVWMILGSTPGCGIIFVAIVIIVCLFFYNKKVSDGLRTGVKVLIVLGTIVVCVIIAAIIQHVICTNNASDDCLCTTAKVLIALGSIECGVIVPLVVYLIYKITGCTDKPMKQAESTPMESHTGEMHENNAA